MAFRPFLAKGLAFSGGSVYAENYTLHIACIKHYTIFFQKPIKKGDAQYLGDIGPGSGSGDNRNTV